ncbi:MAG: NAD(P)-dependent oxidoreductase [Burkholderiales bacterium]
MTRILVTGSAGRVGRRVVAMLRERGDLVTGLDLAPLGRDDPGYREVTGSFADPAAVARAMEEVGAVLHLGAFMSWLPADAARVYEANATGTFVVLQAAAAAKVRRFVLASTGEVYPENRPRFLPLTEEHPREPLSVYGLSKLVAEEMTEFFARTQGLEYTILRFAHTQDARELTDPASFFSGPRFFLRSKIRQQQAFGNAKALAVLQPLDDGTEKLLVQCGEDGTPYRMMIADTRDVATGVVQALDAPRARNATMNLGPDAAVSLADAVALLQARLGLSVVRAHLPGPAVDYTTSNARARELIGFRPRFDFAAMVETAMSGIGPAG